MASETNAPCQPGTVEEPHEYLIPACTSFTSRNHCLGDPKTLDQVVSAASTSRSTLPHHTSPPSTTRHSLAIVDRIASTSPGNSTGDRHLKSIETRPRPVSCFATPSKPMHPTKVQRWSGLTRTVSDWDHGLRRVCCSIFAFNLS
jgi:hypothetical protein